MTEINGIRYGYEGLVQKHGHLPLKLRPETVSNIQSFGGTILGSSRGPQDINEMVDGLMDHAAFSKHSATGSRCANMP